MCIFKRLAFTTYSTCMDRLNGGDIIVIYDVILYIIIKGPRNFTTDVTNLTVARRVYNVYSIYLPSPRT